MIIHTIKAFFNPVKHITISAQRRWSGLNIWLLSDIHSPDRFEMNEVDPNEFDLVLTLGDIAADTMDYILFKSRFVATYGVYGNHDPAYIPGLACLEPKILHIKGWTISGINGSNVAYKTLHKPDSVHVYSEKKIKRKLEKIGYVDILIAHSPPYFITEDEDPIHQGFHALDDYIEKFKPRYVLYGHLHRNQRHWKGSTEVIGITEKGYLKLAE